MDDVTTVANGTVCVGSSTSSQLCAPGGAFIRTQVLMIAAAMGMRRETLGFCVRYQADSFSFIQQTKAILMGLDNLYEFVSSLSNCKVCVSHPHFMHFTYEEQLRVR